ncbi:Spermatid-specific manchette-related protein 1 [Phoenicopterus ruber ruber]|uniref:Spermatid-specific manchette-related protein 1 n=1 Tax=Phoenicopterus ruber ruber TaxID=9218 RepID=A0A091TXU7_PHORB|nr:Spermatid-specific manchette-related protein 1 [Phoenicopterus ruber ruber]
MFLFSKKHKTPISTYTDSYRPPCSIKKTIPDQALQQFGKENKFVTQGLTMPPPQNPASQGQPEQMIKAMMQEYYRNTIDPTACWPEKYWLARSEEKYNPVFINEDKYITWRTGPYNSAAWNKHSSYLPLLPKETRMESFLHSIPVTYPPKPTCLNQYEREVVADMLRRLSRHSSPSLQPVYTVTRRGPFQGYYSPCSGRHYCLRGMDYYVDGGSAIRRHLNALGERAEYPMLQFQPESNVLYIYSSPPAILPVQEP